ncbi:MAG: GTP-binding protein [Syntrophomonadaceae bacterium]|jgi:G3E family GTPase|nr:GTP-binding protein [Syntrophomonadaceae bacterium]
MTAEIYLISGFLGAGKTTFIQKMLDEVFRKNKVVLVENDFGEIGIDAALLKSSGVEIKEINSGCICCSLSGDFVKALKEMLERFQPDKIVIEPSGVAKLSDIVKACSDPSITPLAKLKANITVVDVKRCKIYLDNFGEFFEDQIQNADIVLLSHVEDSSGKIDYARELVKSLNNHARIVADPWEQITAAEILRPEYTHSDHEVGCHRKHEHHECGNGCCEHGHAHPSAENVFDTVNIQTKRIFTTEDLRARVFRMADSSNGDILRAKGIVRTADGYMDLQYIPGDISIKKCATGGDMLCIIGQNLNRQELISLFNGE